MNDAVAKDNKARLDEHAAAVAAVAFIDPGLAHKSSHDITMEIARRMEMPRRDWEEFRDRAVFEHGVALRTLRTWRQVAEEREEQWAEAARQQCEARRLSVLEAEEKARHAAEQSDSAAAG